MTESNEVLARFHRTLVQEIRARRPEYLRSSFTVAEIYQNLVPYGSHRAQIGVDMNGDYEDALLRLLAGEGGFLLLESEPALRGIKEELRSPNPNTGLYREYAAVDVRLDPSRVAPEGDATSSSPGFETTPVEAIAVDDLAPDVTPVTVGGAPAAAPVHAGQGSDTCKWCRADLPRRANLNFCPFCGTDVKVVPCPDCGEELEPDWRFCIACGVEIGS